MKLTNLSSKAVLIKLTIRRANLSRRDEDAENIIQQQMDDRSLTVMSRLFRDTTNPINQLMAAVTEIYTYHKQHTLPWIDKGPRVLPNSQFMEYMAQMKTRREHVDALLVQHMPRYDQYVQQDIVYRSQGVSKRASVDDYPTVTEFEQRMAIQLTPYPMPDRKHFLFDVPQEEEALFAQAMEDAARMAREDAIKRMLEPLRHLTEKLAVPIGDKGAVFRDSAIENVLEGIELARKLNVDADEEITELTRELTSSIGHYADRMDWLRESPVVRKQAKDKLSDIAEKMGAWMQQ